MAKDFAASIPKTISTKMIESTRNMSKAAHIVSGDAQRRAPIGPTGNLSANVFVNVFRRGLGVVAEVIFLEPYAEVQHEEVTYIHPIGGESEYLDKAMAENLGKVQRILAGK